MVICDAKALLCHANVANFAVPQEFIERIMTTPLARLRVFDAFRRQFIRSPEFFARAPGRVNLIGEHTDYSEGLALPCAIDRDLVVAAAARNNDDLVKVWASDLGAAGKGGEFSLSGCDSNQSGSQGDFLDYVKSAAKALIEQGVELRGVELAIASDVPLGSGLSSSAALSVAVSSALAHAAGVVLQPLQLATLAHRSESHFVGTHCGVLDSFAIALGQEGRAVRIDCRTHETQQVAFPKEQLAMLISHSGVERKLAGDSDAAATGYRERVAQCRDAVARCREALPELHAAKTLRDVSTAQLELAAPHFDATLLRRARHVVSENARVDLFCDALVAIDTTTQGRALTESTATLGRLLRASHESLRDDYEVSIPELDALCEDADGLPGVIGSRMMGAGFGGCALHLVATEAKDTVAEKLATRFRVRFGRTPMILRANIAPGASIEDIAGIESTVDI
ncbi:MAG: galactokinase [Myxococcota bacterium]